MEHLGHTGRFNDEGSQPPLMTAYGSSHLHSNTDNKRRLSHSVGLKEEQVPLLSSVKENKTSTSIGYGALSKEVIL